MSNEGRPKDMEGMLDTMSYALDIGFPAKSKEEKLRMFSDYPPDIIEDQVPLAVLGKRLGIEVVDQLINEYSRERKSVDSHGMDYLLGMMGARAPEGEDGED